MKKDEAGCGQKSYMVVSMEYGTVECDPMYYGTIDQPDVDEPGQI